MEKINLWECASVHRQNRFKQRPSRIRIHPSLAMPSYHSKNHKSTRTHAVKTYYRAQIKRTRPQLYTINQFGISKIRKKAKYPHRLKLLGRSIRAQHRTGKLRSRAGWSLSSITRRRSSRRPRSSTLRCSMGELRIKMEATWYPSITKESWQVATW